jgi:hypothetical protein
VTVTGVKIGDVPGLKQSHATEAKAMAERVYPLLYFFENSSVTSSSSCSRIGTEPAGGSADRLSLAHAAVEDHPRQVKDFEPLFPQGQAWVQSMIENDMNVSCAVFART